MAKKKIPQTKSVETLIRDFESARDRLQRLNDQIAADKKDNFRSNMLISRADEVRDEMNQIRRELKDRGVQI